MSYKCDITGKRLNRAQKVSHANNKSKRVQLPNLQTKRIFVASVGQWVKLRLSTRAIRTLNFKSIEQLLKDEGRTLASIGVQTKK